MDLTCNLSLQTLLFTTEPSHHLRVNHTIRALILTKSVLIKRTRFQKENSTVTSILGSLINAWKNRQQKQNALFLFLKEYKLCNRNLKLTEIHRLKTAAKILFPAF